MTCSDIRRFAKRRGCSAVGRVESMHSYAALHDADEITATLVYPLRQSTFAALQQRGHDVSRADLTYGGRQLRLELRGMPFGRGREEEAAPR